MDTITDYRTEHEKLRDARRERVMSLYADLRDKGQTKHRACYLISRELQMGISTVYDAIKRAEAANPQNN
jgi:hypothetical protein